MVYVCEFWKLHFYVCTNIELCHCPQTLSLLFSTNSPVLEAEVLSPLLHRFPVSIFSCFWTTCTENHFKCSPLCLTLHNFSSQYYSDKWGTERKGRYKGGRRERMAETERRCFLMGTETCNYGDWEVLLAAACKLETQENCETNYV